MYRIIDKIKANRVSSKYQYTQYMLFYGADYLSACIFLFFFILFFALLIICFLKSYT